MSETRKPPVGAQPGTLVIDRRATRPRVPVML